MRDYFHEALPTRFLFPIDGDCIDRNDGTDGTVRASVQAAPGSCILVNGVPATEQNGVFTADVALQPGKNLLPINKWLESYFLIARETSLK